MAAQAPDLAAIDQVRGLSDKARCDPPNKTFRDLPLHVGSLTLPSSALDGRPRTSPPKLRRQPLQLSHRQSISMPSPISTCSETPWADPRSHPITRFPLTAAIWCGRPTHISPSR